MKTSESIAEISKHLSQAWKEFNNPKHNRKVTVKTRKGGTYQFEYTDLGGILDEVKPHLSKNGITILQDSYTEMSERRNMICVDTTLIHTSGEWMKTEPLKIPASQNIQDMGGQITYLKRYSLSAMLGISTEEDDDANGTLGNQVTYEKNKSDQTQQTEIGKPVLIAKFKQGGGTEEQFNEWYRKQVTSGFNHNQMDQYLTKALMERNKQ